MDENGIVWWTQSFLTYSVQYVRLIVYLKSKVTMLASENNEHESMSID